MTADVPPGWSTVKLGEIGEALIGLTYEPSSVRRSGTLVLRSSNVQGGTLSFSDNVYVDCLIPGRIRVRDADILICVRNGSRKLIGKSVMLDARVVGETFGAFMAVFRSNANPYLRYFFESDDFKRQVDGHLGATINQITNRSLKSFSVMLPDLREQREIVRRLGDADHLIAAVEQLIAKKKTIRTGLMQELLTGRTRLPGFTGPWVETRLGDVLAFEVGFPFRSDFFSEAPIGARLIRNRDLKSNESPIYYTGDFAKNHVVLPGDVLVGMDGDFTLRIWRDGPALLNQRVGRIRSLNSDAHFMYFALFSPLRQLEYGTGRTTVKHLSHSDIESLVTPLPGVHEQRAIAAVLLDADSELRTLGERLRKGREMKQGMMQQLLTGRTRLAVAEAIA